MRSSKVKHPKTFLIRTGFLKGEMVVAIYGYCISARDYRYVDVWAKRKGYPFDQIQSHRVGKDRMSYQRAMPKLKNAKTHRFDSCVPIHVFRKLGWMK